MAGGEVAYELRGPPGAGAAAPPLVLVHGILGPMAIWDRTIDALADGGPGDGPSAARTVLRYDLFGRGDSARPRARYGLDLFVEQLRDLVDALGLAGPLDLLGLSMGGAVAVGFAARWPGRVRRLGLIAPAGLRRPGALRAARGLLAPLLGEAFMGVLGRGFVRRGLRGSFRAPEREPTRGYIERAAAQADDASFRRALLSTLRSMPLDAMADDFALAGAGREVLLLWGTDDAIAPVALAAHALAAIPHAEAHLLEGAGHNLHYEEPERVNPLLVGFFGAMGR